MEIHFFFMETTEKSNKKIIFRIHHRILACYTKVLNSLKFKPVVSSFEGTLFINCWGSFFVTFFFSTFILHSHYFSHVNKSVKAWIKVTLRCVPNSSENIILNGKFNEDPSAA